ncbi:MAG: hypothetical protein GX424_11275 [Clostridiales bacterium]|nr:hypothetical protein [Clostridiales bacterium]
MNRFQLKLFAILTMLTDHVGAVLFPQYLLFRVIGRLAFPVFVFLIAQGLVYTSNVRAYLGRLFVFALISEVPFDLAFHGTLFYPESQNVFFTLFLGLAAIAVLRDCAGRHPAAAFLFASAMAVLAELLRTDYGWFGVAGIVIFYCFRNDRLTGIVLFSLVLIVFSLLTGTLELFALLSGIPLYFYDAAKKGRRSWKYFFYVFYPAHLLLLYLIRMVAI